MGRVRTRASNPDQLSVRGFFKAMAINPETGEILAEREFRNKMTHLGMQLTGLNLSVASLSSAQITAGQVGVATFAGTDQWTKTNLATQVNDVTTRKLVAPSVATASATSGVFMTCSHTWAYSTNEANHGGTANLQEVGLFNHTHTNSSTMVARAEFGTIVKDTTVQVSFTYELRFQQTA